MKCAYCFEEIKNPVGNLINWIGLIELVKHLFSCKENVKYVNTKVYKKMIKNIVNKKYRK